MMSQPAINHGQVECCLCQKDINPRPEGSHTLDILFQAWIIGSWVARTSVRVYKRGETLCMSD